MLLLEGSCHCGAVRFSVLSHTPQPYMRCYCSICRKTAGGGGYAINIMGEARSLEVAGRRHLGVYRARGSLEDPQGISPARRHFCRRCGSALFVADPRWPEWVYPFASAIDTPLPAPRERVHILLDDKAPWVRVRAGRRDACFAAYPDQSIEGWHKARGLYVE
ncbi:MAG: GFA family protein [Kiloniellaceae bacterium]